MAPRRAAAPRASARPPSTALRVEPPQPRCLPPAQGARSWPEPALAGPNELELRACAAASSEALDARARIESFGRALEDFGVAGDPTPLRAQLRALLGHRCMALARVFQEQPRGASVESLRAWWHEGGERWLSSVLEAAAHLGSRRATTDRTLAFPPTERTAVSLETRPRSPLEPVLCSARDTQCGRESAAWRVRMEQVLYAADARRWSGRTDAPPVADTSLFSHWRQEACARQGSLLGWINCAEQHQVPRSTRLPLGRFRLPTGWLVVLRPGGYWAPGVEVAAFDLATGDAWYAERFWEAHRTDAQHPEPVLRESLRRARADAGALREATLSMLLHAELQEDAQQGTVFPVPVRAQRDRERPSLSWSSGGHSTVSDVPGPLRWLWFFDGCERAHGEVARFSDQHARDEAVLAMLQAAEASAVEDSLRDVPPAFLGAPSELGLTEDGEPRDWTAAHRADLLRRFAARRAEPAPTR